MPRNKVQIQKGLSDAQFEALYGTEEKCRAAPFAWRWPEAFVRLAVETVRNRVEAAGCVAGRTFSSKLKADYLERHRVRRDRVVSRRPSFQAASKSPSRGGAECSQAAVAPPGSTE